MTELRKEIQLIRLRVNVDGFDRKAGRYLVSPTSRYPDRNGYHGRAFGNVLKVSHESLDAVAKAVS